MDEASANLPHPDAIGLWCTPANAVGIYVRIKSTSCPEIGAFLFSALDTGGFSAAGNWRTVACWPSCRNVSRTISPSGNSRAS
jgi:hypothetical protein